MEFGRGQKAFERMLLKALRKDYADVLSRFCDRHEAGVVGYDSQEIASARMAFTQGFDALERAVKGNKDNGRL